MQAVQIQGGTISILIEKFSYLVNAATQFCDFLIQCTEKCYHPTINTIIHKGIGGYQSINNQRVLGSNINKILKIVERAIN